MNCFFLNKIFGFFIFTFNLILTIVCSIYIHKNLSNILSHPFFIFLFIFFCITVAISWIFSLMIPSKKKVQKYISLIQITSILTFLYHFIAVIIIGVIYSHSGKQQIMWFLMLGVTSIICILLLCLINYGYEEVFINYNYDAENQQPVQVIVQQVRPESEIPDDPHPKLGELSVSISSDEYYPSAPPESYINNTYSNEKEGCWE